MLRAGQQLGGNMAPRINEPRQRSPASWLAVAGMLSGAVLVFVLIALASSGLSTSKQGRWMPPISVSHDAMPKVHGLRTNRCMGPSNSPPPQQQAPSLLLIHSHCQRCTHAYPSNCCFDRAAVIASAALITPNLVSQDRPGPISSLEIC